MIFAALLFAAIVTEQNNLWTYAPNYAIFKGDASTPGIAQQWIPYGTFTDGEGSTEYLRVTSNLIGVVASSFDGRYERDYVPLEDFCPTNHWSFWDRLILTPKYPGFNFTNFTDNGEFLASATNNSLRILDRLNAESFLTCISNDNATFSYGVRSTDTLEYNLAHETHDSYERQYHDGVAQTYGSRTLDNMLSEAGLSTAPPIGTSWSSDLPFKAADSNDWASVWPTYSALTNDIHFFDAATNLSCRYYRWHLSSILAPNTREGWFYPAHLQNIWGSDVLGDIGDETGMDLEAALNLMPIEFKMEDVLSADTGWKHEVPPVETGSYWTVSGPIGNFRLGAFYDYGTFQAWDNYEVPNPTNYYVEISYNPGESYYSLFVYDIPTSEQVFQSEVAGDESADVLYFGSYHAQRTRLYANQDDYKHWRNMTQRLDWKRLGIICQLERQMEQTYKPRQEEDYLPLFETQAALWHTYSGTVDFELPAGTFSTTVPVSHASWTFVTQVVEVATTNISRCYPTARLSSVAELGNVGGGGAAGAQIWEEASFFLDLLKGAINNVVSREQLSAGEITITAGGSLIPTANAYLVWNWSAYCNFYPAGGGDPEEYSAGSGTETFAAPALATNQTASLSMYVGKRASTVETRSDESFKSGFIKLLAPHPQTNTWEKNFVGEQTRPTLEVMLDAKGRDFDIYTAADSTDLDWDEIKTYTNKVHRFFRMNPNSATVTSRNLSDNNRWLMVQKLDEEVKSRFQALSGMAIDGAATALVNFNAGEEQAIISQLSAAVLNLSFALAVASSTTNGYPQLVVSAYAPSVADLSTTELSSVVFYFSDSTIEPVQYNSTLDAYLLGSYTFVMSEASMTNQVLTVEPVRVDGHQDQMIKTLWRFKNLRDPTL